MIETSPFDLDENARCYGCGRSAETTTPPTVEVSEWFLCDHCAANPDLVTRFSQGMLRGAHELLGGNPDQPA